MAVKASYSITLTFMIDIKAVYRYYKLQSSTLTKPDIPTTNPPSDWTDVEPSYTSGSTNTLYFVDLTVFTNDTFLYTPVSKSSSYEAAKEAYNKAVAAQNTANNAQNDIDKLKSNIEVVVGTQTAATGSWTGIASFSTLTDGQQITYWLPYAGSGNASLNLTLSDGTTTGAIPCYYGGTTRITTHYSAGNVIRLLYRENVTIGSTTIAKGWWSDANYDSNTYDRIRLNNYITAKTAITAGYLIVSDNSGFYHLAANTAFDITKPILYAGSAISASSTGSNNYLAISSVSLRNNLSGYTGTNKKTCYIVGTLVGNTFTPNSTLFTIDEPTSEDGLVYISLGLMISTYQIYLYPEHPIYQYKNGGFKSSSQIAYEAQSDINDLEIGGRNYILNSKYERLGSDNTYSYLMYDISDEVKNYQGKMTISFDAKRAEDDEEYKIYGYFRGTAAISATNTTSTPTITTEWERYSLTFDLTTDISEALTYTLHITNTTSAVQINLKNVKLETGNRATDWTPAPEDIQSQIDTSIKSVDVEYYLSTSQTALSGGSWSTTAPTWVNGKYMWSRTKTTLQNETTSYTPSSTGVCIAGAKGDTGATGSTGATGTGISSITEEYYLSTSKTTQTGGSWTTTPPTWSSGMYVWTRSKIVYTNPSSTAYTTPICDSSWEAVNEIEVGGKNLVLGTSDVWKDFNVSQYNGTIVGRKHCSEYGLKVGDTITYSVDLKVVNKTSIRARLDFYSAASGEDGKTAYTSGTAQVAKDTEGRLSLTVTIPSGKEYICLMVGNVNTTDDTTTTTEQYKCLKLERGNRATDWTPAPEDIQATIDKKIPLIIGTQTAATYNWTGNASMLSKLEDGQKITYWLPFGYSGSTVSLPYWKDADGTTQYSTNAGSALNLTLSDGTTTDNVACYYSGASRLTSHFAAGNAIELTYRKLVKIGSYYYTGWWANANYYSDTVSYTSYYGRVIARTALSGYKLIVGDSTGYTPIAAGVTFDVTYPILYSNNVTLAAGANTSSSSNFRLMSYNVNVQNTISGWTGVNNSEVYVKGSLEGNTFTIDSEEPITCTKPTEEDGKYYILLGICSYSGNITSTNYIWLSPDHPIYKYSKGAFKTMAQIATDAQDTADNAQDTASNAITRIEGAELNIDSILAQISSLVTDANGTSLMTQTSSGWTFSTANIQNSVNSLSSDLGALTDAVGSTDATVTVLQQAVTDLGQTAEYVRIATYENEPCIELGESDSIFKLMITNTRIMFMEGSNNPTYIDSEGLNTENIEVKNSLKQGCFSWAVRSNGNLGLSWHGGKNRIPDSKLLDIGADSGAYNFHTICEDLVAGEEYTFSVGSSVVDAGSATEYTVRNYDHSTSTSGPSTTLSISSNPVTWTFTATQPALLIYSGVAGSTTGIYITFRRLKLENGSVATPWSPAPTDIG